MNKWKKALFILTTVAVFIVPITCLFAEESIRLIVNGKDITNQFDYKPIIIDGHTYVPARALAESLGAKVEWDGQKRAVIVSNGTNVGTQQSVETKQNKNTNEKYRDKVGSLEYYGEWKDGVPWPRANGIYYYPEGKQVKEYTGSIENGIPHGKGEGIFGGIKFKGSWKNGLPVKGEGKYKNKDEKEDKEDKEVNWIYDGEWENWVPNGEGVFYKDGHKIYEGKVRNYQRHGYGTCYDNYGNMIYQGYFRDNIPER